MSVNVSGRTAAATAGSLRPCLLLCAVSFHTLSLSLLAAGFQLCMPPHVLRSDNHVRKSCMKVLYTLSLDAKLILEHALYKLLIMDL